MELKLNVNIFTVLGFVRNDDGTYRTVSHAVIGTSSADAEKRLIEKEGELLAKTRLFINTDELMAEYPRETMMFYGSIRDSLSMTEQQVYRWIKDMTKAYDYADMPYEPAAFREFTVPELKVEDESAA